MRGVPRLGGYVIKLWEEEGVTNSGYIHGGEERGSNWQDHRYDVPVLRQPHPPATPTVEGGLYSTVNDFVFSTHCRSSIDLLFTAWLDPPSSWSRGGRELRARLWNRRGRGGRVASTRLSEVNKCQLSSPFL